MKTLKILLSTLRLYFTAWRAREANRRLHAIIKQSRVTTEVIELDYSRLLELCIKQERRRVELKRLRQDESADKKLLAIPNDIGEVELTPLARKNLVQFDVVIALERHKNGDWGDVPVADWAFNNEFLLEGGSITSRYISGRGVAFVVSTNEEHTKTQIKLEEEIK